MAVLMKEGPSVQEDPKSKEELINRVRTAAQMRWGSLPAERRTATLITVACATEDCKGGVPYQAPNLAPYLQQAEKEQLGNPTELPGLCYSCKQPSTQVLGEN